MTTSLFTRRCTGLGQVGLAILLALSSPTASLLAAEGELCALFHLTDATIGPFPSDQFTVPDTRQLTGRPWLHHAAAGRYRF